MIFALILIDSYLMLFETIDFGLCFYKLLLVVFFVKIPRDFSTRNLFDLAGIQQSPTFGTNFIFEQWRLVPKPIQSSYKGKRVVQAYNSI